jgi:hypothetical protein
MACGFWTFAKRAVAKRLSNPPARFQADCPTAVAWQWWLRGGKSNSTI